MSEDEKKAKRLRSMLVRRALRMVALHEGPHFKDVVVRTHAMRLLRRGNHAQYFLQDPEDERYQHLYLVTKRDLLRYFN